MLGTLVSRAQDKVRVLKLWTRGDLQSESPRAPKPRDCPSAAGLGYAPSWTLAAAATDGDAAFSLPVSTDSERNDLEMLSQHIHVHSPNAAGRPGRGPRGGCRHPGRDRGTQMMAGIDCGRLREGRGASGCRGDCRLARRVAGTRRPLQVVAAARGTIGIRPGPARPGLAPTRLPPRSRKDGARPGPDPPWRAGLRHRRWRRAAVYVWQSAQPDPARPGPAYPKGSE